MQTIKFNCSSCGKLMAVGLNLVGRNVRCPHCKQVLQAPASAPTEPVAAAKQEKAPEFQSFEMPSKPVEDHDSIFGETQNDDLFGRSPAQSKPPAEFNKAASAPSQAAPDTPAINTKISPTPADPFATRKAEALDLNFAKNETPADNLEPIDELEPLPDLKDDRAAKRGRDSREKQESKGGNIFVWMLLVYALFATAAAAYLFFDRTETEAKQDSTPPNPYLSIPDFFGQYDKADRKKISKIEGLPAANVPLPADCIVHLNQTRRFGDLQVTPVSVEYRKVQPSRKIAGSVNDQKRPEIHLYVLGLKVQNLSPDVYFCPSDPAFSRRMTDRHSVAPYTGLSVGKDYYSGGPFLWPDKEFEFEYFAGQENDAKPLAPQEERTVLIGSDMVLSPIKKSIEDNPQATCQWRVQLRRGLDKVKDETGKDHDISTTCVVGVEFNVSDIKYPD